MLALAIALLLTTTAAAAPAPQSQPGALADAVAAAAAAAPLFIQAFGTPLVGDAAGAWSKRADTLRALGLEIVG